MTKLLSCRYNMDTNRVEARFEDGTTLAIDCITIEDEYGDTRDLGKMAEFLVGDGASYITGQDFAVDGGALAYGY